MDTKPDAKADAKKTGDAEAAAKPGAAKAADPKKATAKAEPEEERDPQVQEAVEVLADLVALTQSGTGSEAVARGGQ